MRTSTIALAAVLAAATLSASAQPRMEPATSPFTYEAVGATPSLAFGRKAARQAVEAPAAAGSPKAAVAGRTGGAARANAGGTFTYDALGATPHVEVNKPAAADIVIRQPAR
jgi:hypothetical protein